MNKVQIDPVRRRLWLDPSDPAFVQDPYPAYAAARQAGPALFWEQYGHWCLFDHAGVSAALRDRRLGREILHVASREELGWPEEPAHLAPFYAVDRLTMLEREPPVHTRLRGLVNRAFVSRQVERLRPRIAAHAHALIDGFASDGQVELIDSFATPIPVRVIAELLGVQTHETGRLLDWSHRMVAMYRINRTRADEHDAVSATNAFVSFLTVLVAERRTRLEDDLISRLIAVQDENGQLSEPELIASCILLLNAGHEATVHAIGNGVKAMLEHRIGSGPDATVASTVEEALRLDPPLHMFTRYALEDLELGDVQLRRGEQVGLMLGAANRDPAAYADPDRFIPGRDGPAQAGFGGGIHFCLGAPLARLELEVVLPILLDRLPGLRMAAVPRYANSYHFHGLAALDLAWER